MSASMLLIIVGMAIVTYVPRMLPLVFLNAKKIHPFLEAVLRNVPYAALGALIFPGILFIHDERWFGFIGGAVAFVLAYLGANMFIVVVGSIFSLYIMTLIFPF